MSHNRFLLISRVGPRGLHGAWLARENHRNFDVLLSAYDERVDRPDGDGVFFERRPGNKVAGYGALLRDNEDLLRTYDYIALFDDDLLVDATSISRLFQIVSDYNLKIAQPSLTHDSHFTFAALLRHERFRLRYVNYVEMMCPVFRADVLLEVRPLFEMGYESGIDLVWCNLVAESALDFAVIDSVVVRHTQPVGARKSENGFQPGERYEDHIYGILERFGIPWLPCLPYSGVGRDGEVITSPLAYLLDAARLALTIRLQRPYMPRARSVAVYWKQLSLARARNIRVDWPGRRCPPAEDRGLEAPGPR